MITSQPLSRPWFEESPDPYMGQVFPIDRLIHQGASDHQDILLFWNEGLGHVLALDGVVQLTEKTEFIYSEAMAHIPVYGHGEAKRVLIIGGGDGAVLEEITKHDVGHVDLVDLDGTVMYLAAEHLQAIHKGAFTDPRVRVHVADGLAFLRDGVTKYDLIIVDGPDPVGPGEASAPLFTDEFFDLVRRRLHPSGVFTIGCDMPMRNPEAIRAVSRALSKRFHHNGLFTIPAPEYQGGVLTVAWASNMPIHQPSPSAERLSRLRYWSDAVHRASFALPPYIRELLS